ncbi:MAG TPA: hypothetical protein VF708_03635 [Pyrinomonadaceae bacterium]|jgi:hypothetical protein
MKRILEISIYRPGDFTTKAAELADVNAHASETQDVFNGHAMVRSRFRDNNFSDFYQPVRGLREATGASADDASKTARIGDEMKQAASSYLEDNAKMAKSGGDDLGLPESPIYSNFSKNLWTTHTRHGSVQSPNRSRENTDGPRQPQGEPLPAVDKPGLVAKEDRLGKVAA